MTELHNSKELAQISKLKQIQAIIPEVKELDEIKRLIAHSEVLKEYARVENLSKEVKDDITVYNLQATRQMGIISRELEKVKANQYTKVELPDSGSSKTETLAEAGIDIRRANEAEELADIPDDEFAEIIEEHKKKDNLSKTAVVQEAKKKKKIYIKKQRRTELEAKGKTITIDYDLRLGDFTEVFVDIPDGSVDLILTDPPYPYEYIDCWTLLSEFASRVLKPHGFCIAYSGQMYLPEVMRRLAEHLDYYWCMAMNMPGGTQIVNGVNMMCMWKPILVYQNGKKMNRNIIGDFFVNEKSNKDGHDWQQGESGIAYLIEKYTNQGELIIDPFCGAGTTLKVAAKLKRNCKSAEIDEATFNIAKARLVSHE